MRPIDLTSATRRLSILCLGAHSDDIEIGCGGTILRLMRGSAGVDVVWVVLAAPGVREEEARRSAERFLAGAGQKDVVIRQFKESYFPYVGAELKDYFEQLKRQVSPDIIFTHQRHDLHQDHRTVCELTWNTFRDHLILEYEIPKYDGDLGAPNFFSPLSSQDARAKAGLLLSEFPSQRARPWFTEDAFVSLMRLRGIESNAPEGFAEAFYCRKIVMA